MGRFASAAPIALTHKRRCDLASRLTPWAINSRVIETHSKEA
jgi:hypothetical protein